MSKKKDKNWFLALVIAGLGYLAWSIYQLIQATQFVCAGVNVVRPTLVILCNPTNTFYVPFGLALGLIAIIVGIFYYANYSKK